MPMSCAKTIVLTIMRVENYHMFQFSAFFFGRFVYGNKNVNVVTYLLLSMISYNHTNSNKKWRDKQ